MARYESVLESVGGTPLIRLTRTVERLRPRIYVKPEWQNPGGSVSDGRVQVIGADPATSAYSGGDGSQKYIEGAGHFVHPEATVDEWPQALDVDVIDDYVTVEDADSIAAIRWLARSEGILAGGSSGVALAAALKVAELRGVPSIGEAVRPLGPRLGVGLLLTDPAVVTWDEAVGTVALVLDRGRVVGTVSWQSLHRGTAYPVTEAVA